MNEFIKMLMKMTIMRSMFDRMACAKDLDTIYEYIHTLENEVI